MTNFVEAAARRAANDSLHDVCTRLETVRNSFHGKEVSASLHRHARTGACSAESVACIHTGVFEHHACADVYVKQVF